MPAQNMLTPSSRTEDDLTTAEEQYSMPSIACEVIVPYNSGLTSLPWTPNKIPDWEKAVAFLFGGISPLAISVVGLWTKPSRTGSTLMPDPQNRYEIAIDQKRVPELREFIRFTCAHFEQECVYFKNGVSIEFIDNPLGWPPAP